MTRVSIRALLMAVLCAVALNAQSGDSIVDAFSPSSGWKQEGPGRKFPAADVDRFDPSMAGTLKGYGLEDIAVQDWVGPNGRAHVTIYRMTDSAAAYGLFSIMRNIDAPGHADFPFGAEGFRIGSRAMFWKGPYTIELEGEPQAVDDWARIAASQIREDSLKPPVSSYLPSKWRVKGSDRYMVSPSNVEDEWGFDPARLGFEKSAEVATARYVVHGKPARLLLVAYPTQQVAKQYEEDLEATYGSAVRFKKRAGPLVAIVGSGADSAAAEALLGEIQHEFQVTWNERAPGPNIAVIILTIFRVIGIALTITLLTGVTFGVVRVLVKRWFPGKVFDRPQDVEVIQLKLNQRVRRIDDKSRKDPPGGGHQ